uniref:NADH-ubiquinone oxidoreductase chain 2 n=1 Tax=Cucujoidea sp. 34 KM-2017 TaxID=2219372 RepID=A0A346RHQ7_9CUCU|nr:NADH dehydrogenase subunit 2 [Cucujoidea sp. 34 KM-2017]
MYKFHKLMFLNCTIVGTLLAISSYSWLSMWMGLEINLISVIPLLQNNSAYSSESMIKYFLLQVMASMILLFSIILMLNLYEYIPLYSSNFLLITLNFSLLMKMGAAPLHFWLPEIMEGLSWMSNFLMMTWQKIAPMILLFYSLQSNMVIIFSISSAIIGSIMGLNQTSLRKLMAFSSINHTSWLLSCTLTSLSNWLVYFSVYTFIAWNLTLILSKFNIFYLKQLIHSMNFNKTLKYNLTINFLSLGGLPPFMGFYPKWITINFLMNNNYKMLTLILIITSLITLYFYTRTSMTSLMFKNNDILIINLIKFKYNFTLLFFLNILAMFIFMLWIF